MKTQIILATLLILSLSVIYITCEKEDLDSQFRIEGLTFDNFPKIDGSTSTTPLNTIIACELLGIKYKWLQSFINLIDKEADIILSAQRIISKSEYLSY